MAKIPDNKLKDKTMEFKERLKKGETLDDILPEAFALVRETAKRVLKQRHFDVQLMGGVVLHKGQIAEMKTGEGKTLTSTSAIYLNALAEQGVHVVTVNDYLAKRDSVWMGQIFNKLGITVSCLQHESAFLYDEDFANEQTHDSERDETGNFKVEKEFLRLITRKEAYLADITYGTNNEFGFDYLRDNMVHTKDQMVQRGHSFAIIDEVDSILIDEARTPLIISAAAEDATEMYYKFARLIPTLSENVDYNIDEKMKSAVLTEAGTNKIEKALGMGNIYTEGGIQSVHHVEEALKAYTLFKKDRDYVVKDGEIIIVDEFTGRLMIGRRYSEGLHQAIEAKEGVEIKQESRTLATITIQNYFRMYKKLGGMTGTAVTEAEEFSKIYKLEVVSVPTNMPMIRKDLNDRIYRTEKGKYMAVVKEIKERHEKGQPVLIGTISIEKNEILSELLDREGVKHQLLNAKQHEKEAEIIAQAGKLGAVTVATNMAGRGVDIILGGNPPFPDEAKKVRELGGLLVLGTERHESRRIDNQLRGRSGRQGDMGESRFYVSLEDDLMRIFGPDRIKNMMLRLGVPEDMPIENGIISKSLESAQRKVEGYNFDIRKHLVEYDDVVNKHRELIYKRRVEILDVFEKNINNNFKKNLKELILEKVGNEISTVVNFHAGSEYEEQWDLEEIYEVCNTIFPIESSMRIKLDAMRDEAGSKEQDAAARTKIIEYLEKLAAKAYEDLEKKINSIKQGMMPVVEKEIMLQSLDNHYISHLEALDYLRGGIGLRGYGQRDPLVEYKKESYRMFSQLLATIDKQIVYSIFKVGLSENGKQNMFEQKKQNVVMTAPSKEMDSSSGQFKGLQKSPFEKEQRKEEPQIKEKARDAEGEKVGRNDPCPCGSGKKYKKCCGK